jgi:hypothetical protein
LSFTYKSESIQPETEYSGAISEEDLIGRNRDWIRDNADGPGPRGLQYFPEVIHERRCGLLQGVIANDSPGSQVKLNQGARSCCPHKNLVILVCCPGDRALKRSWERILMKLTRGDRPERTSKALAAQEVGYAGFWAGGGERAAARSFPDGPEGIGVAA